MPVIAVGFAIAAVAVAVEVGTTLAIIAAVGATIGAIGAVTGNKALMIAGGVIGAVGGLGALATSAGILSADAFSFGSNAAGLASDSSIAGGFTSDAGFAGAVGSDVVPGGMAGAAGGPAVSAAGGTTDFVNMASGSLQPVEGSTSPVIAAADAPNVTPTAAVDNAAIPQGDGDFTAPGAVARTAGRPDSVVGNQTPDVPAVSVPQAPGPSPTTIDPKTAGILNGGQGTSIDPRIGPASYGPGGPGAGSGVTGQVATTTGTGAAGTSADPSIWSKLMDVVGKPGVGTLMSGVVQAGSSFISGATNGLTPAQIAALNAQAAANQAAANMSNLQQENMRQPLPVASRSPPVTGAPTGLINTPPRIPVTGAA